MYSDRILRMVGQFLVRVPVLAKPMYSIYRAFLARFTVGAVGVLFDDDDRVLLVEHLFHRDFPWGLPGGWIERGEMPQHGVEREWHEELNLTVEAQYPVMVWRSPIWKNHIDMAFLMRTAQHSKHDAIQLSAELNDHKWYALDQLPRLDPNHRRVIIEAHALLQRELMYEAQQGDNSHELRNP